jgi:hypothetical protein
VPAPDRAAIALAWANRGLKNINQGQIGFKIKQSWASRVFKILMLTREFFILGVRLGILLQAMLNAPLNTVVGVSVCT